MRRSKYNNVKTVVDGITFHSKKEAKHYADLKYAKIAGELEEFYMQVPFLLPGTVKYLLDFKEYWKGEKEPRYVEVKGFFTRESKIKIKIVEALYNIKIKII